MSQAAEVTPSVTPSTAPVRPNEFNLVWLDMEMTGLDCDNDCIIEIAVVVTDAELNIIGEGPVFAIHQSDETLDKMDAWNKGTHGRSGLTDKVRASTVTEAQAETAIISFLVLTRIVQLKHPALLWLGGVSYSLYLLHPSMQMLSDYLLRDLQVAPLYSAVLATALTLVIAYLSLRFIETPFIQLGKRLNKRHAKTQPVRA